MGKAERRAVNEVYSALNGIKVEIDKRAFKGGTPNLAGVVEVEVILHGPKTCWSARVSIPFRGEPIKENTDG